MSWTPEQRRRYAPAISEAVRASATVRLAGTIDAIDPPARTGRPRLWSTLAMLQALWWLCRAGAAWKLLPGSRPPRQTIGSRLGRRVRPGVLDRALAVPVLWSKLTFGRLPRHRRLRVDHEGGTGMSRVMTLLAALFMTGARFERQITA